MSFLLRVSPLTREAVVFAILIGVVLLGAVVVFVLRTRRLPSCWNCGFSSVHRAHSSRSLLDTFARACFLYPYRCQRCLHRFYCFGSPRAHRHSATKTIAAGQS